MSHRHLPVFGQPQVGTPGIRDVDGCCEMFDYGFPVPENTCEGDGHYMCGECKHWKFQVYEGDETRFTRVILQDVTQ